MPKATEGEASGLINNGRRLFLLGVAGTAVVLTGCGGGGGGDAPAAGPRSATGTAAGAAGAATGQPSAARAACQPGGQYPADTHGDLVQ